jgi:hypothetical protein
LKKSKKLTKSSASGSDSASDSRRVNQKALRGVPIFYEQVKQKYTITLTPELNQQIIEEAKEKNTSKSELIETVFRQRYGMTHTNLNDNLFED